LIGAIVVVFLASNQGSLCFKCFKVRKEMLLHREERNHIKKKKDSHPQEGRADGPSRSTLATPSTETPSSSTITVGTISSTSALGAASGDG
jgi:hypothetical protein